MNINYKQPQFELFSSNSATLEDINKPKFLLANLTLSLESLVILVILGIMVALFSFSLGVERGKHLTAQALDERVAAAWNLAPRKPALPVAASKQISAPVQVKAGRNNGFINARQTMVVPVKPMTKAAVPVAVAASALSGRFIIQAATYKNEAYAKQEALALKAKGLQAFLIKKGDFWLICAGPYGSAEAANGALKRVKSKYPGSNVRRF